MSSTVKFQNGLNGASQGAQMGGMFGAWGAVIGGALGAALGLMTPDYEGKAIKKHNDEVVQNAMHDLFDLRRVQNAQNMQTAQTLMQYKDQRMSGNSQVNVLYGAAEIVGSSAQALKQALDFQTNEAMVQTMWNWDASVAEHNQEIHRITNSARNNLVRERGQRKEIDYSGLSKTLSGAYRDIKSGNAGMGAGMTEAWGDVKAGASSFGNLFSGLFNKGGGGSTGGTSSGGGGFSLGSFFGGGK